MALRYIRDRRARLNLKKSNLVTDSTYVVLCFFPYTSELALRVYSLFKGSKLSFSGVRAFNSVRLLVYCALLLPLVRFHRVLREVVLYYDVVFLFGIRAVGLKHEQFSLPELALALPIENATNIVYIVSYFESFLEPSRHLHRPFSAHCYLGFRTPVMMKGELESILLSIYSCMLNMGIPEDFVILLLRWRRE